MELILISQKSSKNSQQEKSPGSESETETISVSSKATIIENHDNHFDFKGCTPKAVFNWFFWALVVYKNNTNLVVQKAWNARKKADLFRDTKKAICFNPVKRATPVKNWSFCVTIIWCAFSNDPILPIALQVSQPHIVPALPPVRCRSP